MIDDDRRRQGIEGDARRIDHRQAVYRWKPKPAIASLAARWLATAAALQAGKAIRPGITVATDLMSLAAR